MAEGHSHKMQGRKAHLRKCHQKNSAILDLVFLNILILANNYCVIPAGERKSQ